MSVANEILYKKKIRCMYMREGKTTASSNKCSLDGEECRNGLVGIAGEPLDEYNSRLACLGREPTISLIERAGLYGIEFGGGS